MNSLIRSPEDSRDWVYEGIALAGPSKFPKTYDLRPALPLPRNQGVRGTCAAFTACCIKEYHETIDHPGHFSGYMSPEFVYFFRQNKPNPGMYCRDVMRILKSHGVSHEHTQPYGRVAPRRLHRDAVEDAKRFKVKGYAQIHTIDGAKKALMTSGPLLVAFPYYDNGRHEFWQPVGTLNGGHAVACVGWTKEGFIIRNSWGVNWCEDGYVIYPFSDWGMHWEMWSAVDEQTQWTLPKKLTEPKWKRRIRRGIPRRQWRRFIR